MFFFYQSQTQINNYINLSWQTLLKWTIILRKFYIIQCEPIIIVKRDSWPMGGRSGWGVPAADHFNSLAWWSIWINKWGIIDSHSGPTRDGMYSISEKIEILDYVWVVL